MTSIQLLRAGACAAMLVLAAGAQALQGRLVASGFEAPLYVTGAAGDPRLFVVEKGGTVRTLSPDGRRRLFLDVSALIDTEGARGLLGMAFDPDYASNGRFYIDYVDKATLNTVIARYTVSPPSAPKADPGTRQTVITVTQETFVNHKGGWIGFRPGDRRNLYIAMGDGGGVGGNDPNNNAQNPQVLLGKLLRIDVSGTAGGYAIPADNPFAGSSEVREEIWALGMRNPFRISFDRLTSDFWIADVGQDTREELNFEAAGDPGGHNYGWRLREGTVRTPGPVGGNKPGLTDPIFDYPHLPSPKSLGDSITGGYVYRGPSIAGADGRYFFGDYVANQIYSFVRRPDGRLTDGRVDTDALIGSTGLAGINSFGEDGAGRLYVVGYSGQIVLMCPDAPAKCR